MFLWRVVVVFFTVRKSSLISSFRHPFLERLYLRVSKKIQRHGAVERGFILKHDDRGHLK
jgi:hypothetical protein